MPEDGEVRAARKAVSEAAPGNHKYSGGSGEKFTFIVFLSLLWHLVDGFVFNFSTSASITTTRFLVYLVLSILLVKKLGKHELEGAIGFAALGLIMPYFLPWIQSSFLSGVASATIIVFWAVTPIHAVYCSFLNGDLIYKIWSIFWILYLGLVLTTQVAEANYLPELAQATNVNAALTTVTQNGREMSQNVYASLRQTFQRIPNAVQRQINYATGGYYTGMVEDQQGDPVGIYIDRLRFANQFHYTEEPIYLWADIRGKSFQDVFNVKTSCFTYEGIQGTTTPLEFSIYQEGFEAVQCKFDKLPEGSHTIYVEAHFSFETWSYVTYTFVDQDTILNFLSQRKDVNRQLEVDRVLKPIYTPGPVGIGMSSEFPQPIGVAPGAPEPVNTVFGVTLANLWTDGEIANLKEFLILIPNIFEFRENDCDMPLDKGPIPDPFCSTDPDRCAENMDGYSFKSIGAPKNYRSVTCRLYLKPGIDPNDLIRVGEQKVQHTFVVKADYSYKMRQRTTIGVTDLERRRPLDPSTY